MLTRKRNVSALKIISSDDVESMSDGTAASSEWRISDCSSDEENRNAQPPHNGNEQPDSPLDMLITWSSDEEDGRAERSSNLLNCTYLKRCSYSTPQQKTLYNRRPPLPQVSIKRKAVDENKEGDGSPRRALTAHNSNLQERNETSPKTSISPWCKVRKVFAPLRPTPSHIIIASLQKTPTKETTQATLDERRIDWSSSSSGSEAGSPTHAKARSSTQQSSAPTELDLMVALIERDYAAAKRQTAQAKAKAKLNSRKRRRCRKGGLLEQFRRLRDSYRAERKFLQHDQKLGLQSGVRLRVLQLENAFGVHMATVALDENVDCDAASAQNQHDAVADAANTLYIVLNADMAAHTKVGSRLEAFFDTNVQPYELLDAASGSKELIYLQPHKLLLL